MISFVYDLGYRTVLSYALRHAMISHTAQIDVNSTVMHFPCYAVPTVMPSESVVHGHNVVIHPTAILLGDGMFLGGLSLHLVDASSPKLLLC